MELERHVDVLRDQLALAAEAGGDEARALAQRLAAPLDAAVRLMLLNVLAEAAAEITRELAPGSVELRLRANDPEFVVTAPPADAAGTTWESVDDTPTVAGEIGEGGMARVNLRLPDQLKGRVEQAADREGLSINAWLVRAAAVSVERGEAAVQRQQATPRGGQSHTGWGR
jgi:hypothetical protein